MAIELPTLIQRIVLDSDPYRRGLDDVADSSRRSFSTVEDAARRSADGTSVAFRRSGAEVEEAAKRSAAETARAWDTLGSQSERAGRALTAGITVPIVGVGVAAVKTSLDFESAFAGVRKTVDASEAEFAVLRQGIRDMAKEMPAAATEIAAVAEAAGQLGIRNEAILGFTKTMIDLGETTNLSANEAAESLARLANITQMPQDEFDRLGSTVVDLGNKLAATEADIVSMGLRIAGAGHQIGLTEAQILGFAGALSSVGIEAEAGGSAISRTFIKIANAVAEGGESVAGFAAVAGLTVPEFQRLFEQDAATAVTRFVEGLGRVSAEGDNVFATLENLGIQEIRERDALLRLAGAGDLLANSLAIGNAAWEENTALLTEAETRYGTNAARLEVLWNKLKDTAITLGDALVPALMAGLDAATPFFGMLENIAQAFADLPKSAQVAAIGFVGIGAALGPVLYIMGNFIQVISGVSSAVKAYTVATAAAKAGTATMMQGFIVAAAPIAAVIVAIAAIGAALYASYHHFDGFREVVDATWQGVQRAWDAVTNVFVSAWQDYIHPTLVAMGGFFVDYVLPAWQAGVSAASTVWDALVAAVRTAWDVVSTVVSFAWTNVIEPTWKALAWFVENVLVPVWGFIANAAGVAWEIVSRVVEVAWAVLQIVFKAIEFAVDNLVAVFRHWSNVAGEVWNVVGTVISFAWENVIKPVFGFLDDFVIGVLVVTFNFWKTTAELVWQAVSAAIRFAWENVIQPAWQAIQWAIDNVLIPVFNALRDGVEIVWNAIAAVVRWAWDNVVLPVWNAIKAVIDTVLLPTFNAFRDGVEIVWNAIATVVQWGWDNVIKPVWEKIDSFIHSILLPAFELIQTVGERVWKAFTAAAETAWNGLKSAIGPVLRLVGDAVGLFLKTVSGVARAVGLTPLADALQGWGESAYGWGEGLAKGGKVGVRQIGPGFKTDGPTAVVGEGRQNHPEYVIATDPAYRERNRGLWMAAGRDLGYVDSEAVRGIPGFQIGGIIDAVQSGADWVTDAAGNVVEFVGGAVDWTFEQVRKLTRAALGELWPKLDIGDPNTIMAVPPSGVNRVRDAVLDFLWEEKEKKTTPAAGGGGLAGSSSGLDPEFLNRFNAWNASLGNTLSIVSGFRTYAEQQALYDAYLAGTGNLAAPPGSSMHERGLAIDHSPSSWELAETSIPYRLHHPVPGEPWHVEPFAKGGIMQPWLADRGGILPPGSYAFNGNPYPEAMIPLARGGTLPFFPGNPVAPWDNPFFNPAAWASREFDEVLTGPEPDAPTAYDLRDSPTYDWPAPWPNPGASGGGETMVIAPGAFHWAPRFEGEVSPAVLARMKEQIESAMASILQALRAQARR